MLISHCSPKYGPNADQWWTRFLYWRFHVGVVGSKSSIPRTLGFSKPTEDSSSTAGQMLHRGLNKRGSQKQHETTNPPTKVLHGAAIQSFTQHQAAPNMASCISCAAPLDYLPARWLECRRSSTSWNTSPNLS